MQEPQTQGPSRSLPAPLPDTKFSSGAQRVAGKQAVIIRRPVNARPEQHGPELTLLAFLLLFFFFFLITVPDKLQKPWKG